MHLSSSQISNIMCSSFTIGRGSFSNFIIYTVYHREATNYCPISHHDINIIKQPQSSILFQNGFLWTNRNNLDFCIAMGAFDLMEAWELIRILLLWRLRFIVDIKITRLYTDNGIILMFEAGAEKANRLRKNCINLFKEHDLCVTITNNVKVVNLKLVFSYFYIYNIVKMFFFSLLHLLI